jgi:hypothetical protein
MSYKFHKVYANRHTTNADISSPIIAKKESPKSSIWRSVKRFFRKKWLNFITTVVLILTLWVYWESNEINRKATIISHTPWVAIIPAVTTTKLGPNLVSIDFDVENKSDYPAIDYHSSSTVFDPSIPHQEPIDSSDKATCLMPHTIAHQGGSDNVDSPEAFLDKIDSGKAIIEIKLFYSDAFRDKITIAEYFAFNSKTKQFEIQKTEATGFQTF